MSKISVKMSLCKCMTTFRSYRKTTQPRIQSKKSLSRRLSPRILDSPPMASLVLQSKTGSSIRSRIVGPLGHADCRIGGANTGREGLAWPCIRDDAGTALCSHGGGLSGCCRSAEGGGLSLRRSHEVFRRDATGGTTAGDESGTAGIFGGLRIQWGNPSGFDSRLSHSTSQAVSKGLRTPKRELPEPFALQAFPSPLSLTESLESPSGISPWCNRWCNGTRPFKWARMAENRY